MIIDDSLHINVMKLLDKVVVLHLRPQVSSFPNLLQFTYQALVGMDDAVIYLLQKAHSYLDYDNTTVRITFFDFSSTFNTIQPLLLRKKMRRIQVDMSMVSWVTD